MRRAAEFPATLLAALAVSAALFSANWHLFQPTCMLLQVQHDVRKHAGAALSAFAVSADFFKPTCRFLQVTHGDRSKGPCKGLQLRRLCVLC